MMEKSADDVDMNSSDIVFDNPRILKEFGNIINVVSNEDFLAAVPKAKLKELKWIQTFNFMKQGIFNEMVQELNSMWKYEKMPEKIEILNRQKEKFSETDASITLWRPQLGDVKAQLKAHDAAHLRKQKKLLENLAKEYEIKLSHLKKTVSGRRTYIKALKLDIQKYFKKVEDLGKDIDGNLENHDGVVDTVADHRKDFNWSQEETIERDST